MNRRSDRITETRPAGELAERMRLILDRLTGSGFPAYTPEFVLADVRLDPVIPVCMTASAGTSPAGTWKPWP